MVSGNWLQVYDEIEGLVWACSSSIANTLELQ